MVCGESESWSAKWVVVVVVVVGRGGVMGECPPGFLGRKRTVLAGWIVGSVHRVLGDDEWCDGDGGGGGFRRTMG